MFDLPITEEERSLGFEHIEIETGYGTIFSGRETKKIVAKVLDGITRIWKTGDETYVIHQLIQTDTDNINSWAPRAESPLNLEQVKLLIK